MTGEVPPRELGERQVAVDGRRLAEPVADERVGMLAAAHRPAHGDAADAREEEQVHERLPPRRDAGPVEPLAELEPRERPVGREAPLDRRDGTVGGPRRDLLQREPPRDRGAERRRRQRLEPRVVLAADEVERAAVQPREHERALVGQLAVDVRGREPGAARTDREPRAARVLRLDGEQPLHDRERVPRRRPGEKLRREPLGEHGHRLAAVCTRS